MVLGIVVRGNLLGTADRNLCSILSFNDRTVLTVSTGRNGRADKGVFPVSDLGQRNGRRALILFGRHCPNERSAASCGPEAGPDQFVVVGELSSHLRAVNTWRRLSPHIMPLMDQRDWLRVACRNQPGCVPTICRTKYSPCDSPFMQIDWQGRPFEHHCYQTIWNTDRRASFAYLVHKIRISCLRPIMDEPAAAA